MRDFATNRLRLLAILILGVVSGGAAIYPAQITAAPRQVQAASSNWTAIGNLTTTRSGHSATLLPNGKVLVAGGVGPNDAELQTAELYDPATGRFTPTEMT